ncbi:hypothetical protein SLEP1_g20807 [Rubroshorea leprosula]|uniref:Beta-glucosidase n=1 Tax=Rubroshorea leprosula TaxID=152421 RepID=A0AAV5J747_9ROSI|nr:hypothetical protein SLEP1_g20807 [Rubroshorea leprosula]
MKYKDATLPVEVRIQDLFKRMTLAEKIGQMAQVERENTTAHIVKKYKIVKMLNKFQKGSLRTRLGIPLIYGIDAVQGHNHVYNATIFPHNVGLGVTRDPELVKRIGAATALEVRATAIRYTFAPWIAGDVPKNMNGLPYVHAKAKVAACAKHYVGDGGTVKGINENNTIVNPKALFGIHMPAYLDSLAKGVATIMASYSSVNGVKMHANYNLLTRYLKHKLGFKGFIISDYRGIDKITYPEHKNYTYSLQLASILAGIDMVMIPYNYTEFINGVTNLVKKGVIPMNRIDDAVTRILRVKFTMGLFENRLGNYKLAHKVGCKDHRELAREAVRKSLVLLKNGKSGGKPLLPLPKKAKKTLVAGTHAHNLYYQCGGWTIEWQRLGSNNLTSGEVPYAETRGDNQNLTLPASGLETIKNICGSVKCVVIVVSGRPLVIERYLESMDALVAAWLPGSEGQRVADVVFGDFGFTGKLARTWFKRVDQLPMNVGRLQPNEFINWLHTVERVLELKDIPDDNRVKLVAIKLKKHASIWWENLKHSREREGRNKIRTWEKMHRELTPLRVEKQISKKNITIASKPRDFEASQGTQALKIVVETPAKVEKEASSSCPAQPNTRKCFKCQGFGHIASNYPNRKIITIIGGEIHEVLDGEAEKEISDEIKPQLEEELITADHGESLVVRRSPHDTITKDEDWLRHNIFHTRCTSRGKVCNVIIDSGSCENVVSSYMVEKLGLPVKDLSHPYKLQWLQKGNEVKVTKCCLVSFSISNRYQDEVWCDVIPMDACHLLLGHPWQFDRKAIHDGHANTYSFVKDGVKVKLTPLKPEETLEKKDEDKALISRSTFQKLHQESRTACLLLLSKVNDATSPFLEEIRSLLEEFSNVVPDETPHGLPRTQ